MATTVIVTFKTKPGKTDELCSNLIASFANASQMDGFIDARLYSDLDDPDVVIEVEHWNSAADHKRALQLVQKSGAAAKLAELLLDGFPSFRYLGDVADGFVSVSP